MVAVDTNVVVRLLVGDDPIQSRAAKRLFAKNAVWISRTVLVETVWVLGSVYGVEEAGIRAALVGLLGLEQVTVEDGEGVRLALAWAEKGMELADALNVSAARDLERFVTFDRRLVKSARVLGLGGVGLAWGGFGVGWVRRIEVAGAGFSGLA